jgi:predicted PurR-regulated permease PerM
MASGQLTYNETYLNPAREIFIHLGFLFLLVAACFLILLPFLPLIAWGIIIAIAVHPGCRKLQTFFGVSGNIAAVVCTLLLVALLIVPVVLLSGTLVDGIQTIATRIREGSQIIPPPPSGVERWPIIGIPLRDTWMMASVNFSAALKTFAPQIKALIPSVLSASAAIGMAGLQLVLSILIAGVLLAKAESATQAAQALADRLFGERGQEFVHLAGTTVRSVTTGIIGVAIIQTVFAGVGFLIFGLPGAGLWAVIFLVAAILQVGALVLIPAVIYMFAIASTTKAVLFLIWCGIVAVMDNILKPLLLGRGVAVPIVVVFLGAIGGFLAIGIMGLFVGAVVLSVGYKLFLGWLEAKATSDRVVGSRPNVA